MQKRHVLVCEGSLCPRKLSDVSGPGLGEAGRYIGAVLISPNGDVFEFSNRLEEECTNNQVEYEALLFGLEFLQSMGVKHVEAFVDSLLWCSKYLRYASAITVL